MTPARFGVQAAVVLLLIVLVSWPEPARLQGADDVWRTDGPLAGTRVVYAVGGRSRAAAGRRYEIGYGSASLERASALGSSSLQRLYENGIERRRRRNLPAGVLALGGRLNAILGRARTALNAAVPHARVVLRNVVTGVIEARATADEKGDFTFLDVLPSGYVVELLGTDGSVLATSELVTIDVEELRETTVRVSTGRALRSAFGSLAPTAHEPVGAAAQRGIRAVTPPDATISPQR